MDMVADGLAAMVPIPSLPVALGQAYHPFAMDPAVGAAEMAYYRACVAIQHANAANLQAKWEREDTAECRMYRAIKSN